MEQSEDMYVQNKNDRMSIQCFYTRKLYYEHFTSAFLTTQ